MVAKGRAWALRDTLVHVVGEEHADTLMASLGPEAETEGTARIVRQAGAAGAGLPVLNR